MYGNADKKTINKFKKREREEGEKKQKTKQDII